MKRKMYAVMMFLFVAINDGFAQGDLPIKLSANMESAQVETNKIEVMRVSFVNVSSNDVRILRTFDKRYNQRIWFSMEVVDQSGTPMTTVATGGKVSIRGNMDYITLKPFESFGFLFDYNEFVAKLTPGRYTAKITYSNQYGSDCFHGSVSTDHIEVNVPAP